MTAPRQDRLAAVPAAQVAAETPAEDLGRLYGHVKRDLIRIALVSGLMFAFIIASKVVLKG